MTAGVRKAPGRAAPGRTAGGAVAHATGRGAVAAVVAGALLLGAAAPGQAAEPGAEASAAGAGATVGEQQDGGEYDASTVLVRFRTVVSEPGQERVAAQAGAELGSDVGVSGWTRVDTAGRDPRAVQAELARDPAVAAVELDPVRRVAATPDDTFFAQQSGLRALQVPAAWDVTTGSSATVIAVLDTGVDAGHPDLAGRVLPGVDVANRDGDPTDDNGHGTGVAGAAAATGDNGVGIAGVDWQARVLPVKVLRADGQGRDSDIAEGIRWAVDQGATVLNLSLGGPDRSSVLDDAVAYALGRGVVVVAAAGNTGRHELSYPAALPGVIAVAATGDDGAPASFSTAGDWVDVAAPGVSVATTGLSGRYVGMTGTSFAAPLVAGVVGLVRAQHPTWDPAEVLARLEATARDVGAVGPDTRTGAGLVDAAAAVARAASETPGATVATPLSDLHARLGGAGGVLGPAVSPELPAPDGRGRFRHYRGGSIYWTPTTGAREIYGSIRERWAGLGWERSPVGYPVTGELPTPDNRGRYNHFERGSVYWSPTTGAHEVYGSIRERWAAMRWEAGVLGFPRTGETSTPDRVGRYNHFQGGSIYWSPTTGAHAVYGSIRERWAALGWERSALGYPTRSEYEVPGGRASDFQRGTIRWDRATGALTVTTR